MRAKNWGIWWIAPKEMLYCMDVFRASTWQNRSVPSLRHQVQMMRCCTHSEFISGGPKTEAGRCFPDWDRSISNDLTGPGRRYVKLGIHMLKPCRWYIFYIFLFLEEELDYICCSSNCPATCSDNDNTELSCLCRVARRVQAAGGRRRRTFCVLLEAEFGNNRWSVSSI